MSWVNLKYYHFQQDPVNDRLHDKHKLLLTHYWYLIDEKSLMSNSKMAFQKEYNLVFQIYQLKSQKNHYYSWVLNEDTRRLWFQFLKDLDFQHTNDWKVSVDEELAERIEHVFRLKMELYKDMIYNDINILLLLEQEQIWYIW